MCPYCLACGGGGGGVEPAQIAERATDEELREVMGEKSHSDQAQGRRGARGSRPVIEDDDEEEDYECVEDEEEEEEEDDFIVPDDDDDGDDEEEEDDEEPKSEPAEDERAAAGAVAAAPALSVCAMHVAGASLRLPSPLFMELFEDAYNQARINNIEYSKLIAIATARLAPHRPVSAAASRRRAAAAAVKRRAESTRMTL